MDLASQIWVTVFGLAALLCVQLDARRWRRLGVLLGVVGQPGWYCQLVIHDQWGMLPVFVGYTAVWLLGVWRQWGPRAWDRASAGPEARRPAGSSSLRPPAASAGSAVGLGGRRVGCTQAIPSLAVGATSEGGRRAGRTQAVPSLAVGVASEGSR